MESVKLFEETELTTVMKRLKLRKSDGTDGIYKTFEKNARRWILNLFGHIVETGRLPKLFKPSKVVAIFKLRKDADSVSLLNVMYKLLARLVYNRIYAEHSF